MSRKTYSLSKRRLKSHATFPNEVVHEKSSFENAGGQISAVITPALVMIGLPQANVEKQESTTGVESVPQRSAKRKMVVGEEGDKSKQIKMPRLTEDEEIQQKIEDQIRMREGAMKLMSASSTVQQALEVSKNLLTINARVLGLMSALQKTRESHVLREYNKQRKNSTCSETPISPCLGRVSIEDIRVPLMWKDNVHFTGKTGDQTYYAFALVRCGDQVRDTTLYQILASDTDVYFEKALVFDDVGADFKMEFELYYTVIQEGSMLRAPMRTPNRKAPQVQAPKFCLAGHVQLNVDDVKKGIISKDLYMGSLGAIGTAVLGDMTEFPPHPLELWGQICCTLAAQPRCMTEESLSGYVQIKEHGEWRKYFCSLHQCKLRFWLEEANAAKFDPHRVIALKANAPVKETIGLDDVYKMGISVSAADGEVAVLAFVDVKECYQWLADIRKAVHNLSAWKNACQELMTIQQSAKRILSVPAGGSFYDQIKIGDLSNVAVPNRSPDNRGLTNALLDATLASPSAKTHKLVDSSPSPPSPGQPGSNQADSQAFLPRSSPHRDAGSRLKSELQPSADRDSPWVVLSKANEDVETEKQDLSPPPSAHAAVQVLPTLIDPGSDESSKGFSDGAAVSLDAIRAESRQERACAADGSGVSNIGESAALLPRISQAAARVVDSPDSLPEDVVAEATIELEELDRVLDDSVADSAGLDEFASKPQQLDHLLDDYVAGSGKSDERTLNPLVGIAQVDLDHVDFHRAVVSSHGNANLAVIADLEDDKAVVLVSDSPVSACPGSVSDDGNDSAADPVGERPFFSTVIEACSLPPSDVAISGLTNGCTPDIVNDANDEDDALNAKIDEQLNVNARQAAAPCDRKELDACADTPVADSSVACTSVAGMAEAYTAVEAMAGASTSVVDMAGSTSSNVHCNIEEAAAKSVPCDSDDEESLNRKLEIGQIQASQMLHRSNSSMHTTI